MQNARINQGLLLQLSGVIGTLGALMVQIDKYLCADVCVSYNSIALAGI